MSLHIERPVTPYVWKKNASKRGHKFHVSDASAIGLEAAERDAADLLYRHGIGSILVSILASSGLAFISIGQVPSRLLEGWWLLITLVLVLRGIDIVHYHKVRTFWTTTGRPEIQRFASGVIATAALWAAFPLAFLRELNQTGRACTTIILCGMVGGSATVLAPSKTLSFLFCSFLVLPTSISLFQCKMSLNRRLVSNTE